MTDADFLARLRRLGEQNPEPPFDETAFQHWRSDNGYADNDTAHFLFRLIRL